MVCFSAMGSFHVQAVPPMLLSTFLLLLKVYFDFFLVFGSGSLAVLPPSNARFISE